MRTYDSALISLAAMSEQEMVLVRGGEDFDKTLAGYVGLGMGYGLKKICRAFKFLSNNLYNMQKETMIIYK